MNLEEDLKNKIKSVIIFNPNLVVLPPNTIPQLDLKAKRVIDKREKI